MWLRERNKALNNVPVARCSGCQRVVPITGYWGEQQERQLCMRCDNVAWAKLLKLTGRLADWKKFLRSSARRAPAT